MKKLGSEKNEEAKRKRNTLALSIFMLVVLVGGTAGYAFVTNPGSDTNNQNSGEIRQVGNRWIVTVEGTDFSFANSPESVQNISVEITAATSLYAGKFLYLVSDNNAVNSEIATTLGTYASRVQKACYGPCDEDLPEKDCSENLIIWQDSSENKVHQEENCVFIEGDLRSVDAFLYSILGV